MAWYSKKHKRSLPKYEQIWRKIRKKAPRVPDITCPWIDDVISILDELERKGKKLTATRLKTLTNKMERLRSANSDLRDSGQYWHDACRDLVDDVFKFKKYKYYKK
jgi:hypothetical protein